MEEAQGILLEALEMAGIVIPPGVAAVQDISPAALISMCSQALGMIGQQEEVYMPGSVPQSVSRRFRVCMQLAERVTQLGYRDDLSFHQFLYPNEADVHRLLRFLLDKISRTTSPSSASGRPSRRRRNVTYREGKDVSNIDAVVRQALSGWSEVPDTDERAPAYPPRERDSEDEDEVSSNLKHAVSKEGGFTGSKADDQPRIITGGKFVDMPPDKEKLFMELLSELHETELKIAKCEKENFSQTATEGEPALLRADDLVLQQAVEVIERCSGSPQAALEMLEAELEATGESFSLAEKEWKTARESLEADIASAEHSLETSSPRSTTTVDQKLLNEIEDIYAKINARKNENAALTARLERQPQQAAPRSSYIRRISELVKNSKKQETDVTKIISETRILQRDYNATQERLGRIHVLVDECIFRDAKNEAQCRLAYRLLSSIHESFSGLVENVLEMDKLDWEIADIQGKLESYDHETIDIDRVKGDLHAILAEKKEKNGA